MKKTFLKAVVATTVVAATMALSSVAAFANYGSNTADGKTILTWDFAEYTDKVILQGEKASVDYENLKLVGNGSSSDYVTNKGFHFGGGSNANRRYIEYTTPYAGTLSATFTGNDKTERKCFIGTDSTKTDDGFLNCASSINKAETTVSSEVAAETTYRIYADTALTISKVEFSYDTALDTEPSLKLNPTGLSIKQGQSDTVTAEIKNIDGNIDWSSSDNSVTVYGNNNGATITVAETAEAGKKVTITAKAGTLQETVTVTVVDKNEAEDYVLTADSIPETLLPVNKHFGTKGMFVVEKNVKNSHSRIQVGKGAGIKFKAVTDGTLNIYGVASSNGTANRTLRITEDNADNPLKTIEALGEKTEEKHDSGNITLKAGSTYYIDSMDSGINIDKITVNGILEQIPIVIPEIASTKTAIGKDFFAVDAANGNTYIIHAVTLEELEKSSLALQGKNKTVAETDTVYTTVEFTDGSSISATDLSAEAIYAVCVTGTDAIAPSKEFTWVTTD